MPKYKPKYPRVAQLKTSEDLKTYLNDQNIDLPFDSELITGLDNPYAETVTLKNGQKIGNRLCILPMEGWDGTLDGKPTHFTKNRWRKFAMSGAKLLFGCEAVAVNHTAKANPNQLVMSPENFEDFVELRNLLETVHLEHFGDTSDFYIGLQLTHSGRFCKPKSHSKFESKTLYAHPLLDAKFHVDPEKQILTDDEIDEIIQDYINAAVLAQKAGYHFIDIKHCHGYLGHEFLSAKTRPGKYGGSFENRTRYLKNIAEGIKKAAPGLGLGMRLSAYDALPFIKSAEDVGQPSPWSADEYPYAFGAGKDGINPDLTETFQLLEFAKSLGVEIICITAGSPYYNPHITRPALFPPSDGYAPPEEPLVGVKRHIDITAAIKNRFPDLFIVGSGYSYLQEWLPNVGQNVLRNKKADSIGIGRMVLSYPTMPADIINGNTLVRNLICRSFSDCTTAPRNGIISGCFPLDPYYKKLPEHDQLKAIKADE